MPYKEGQPTLMGCLGWIPLKHVVQKQLFGGRYLTQYNYFVILQSQYESGAVLGRARHNKTSELEKILVVPGLTEGEIIKVLQDAAKERLDGFKEDTGKEPVTFSEFIFFRELEHSGLKKLLDDAILSTANHLKVTNIGKKQLNRSQREFH